MTIELHNNVYCEGEGIPVVLVHGFPVDHRMWNECADALKTTAAEHGMKQFPIWLPTCLAREKADSFRREQWRQRHGRRFLQRFGPYGRRLRRPVARCRIRQGDLVGLSMGGYLILDVQRLHPEAVAALALCDTKAAADSEKMRAKRIAIAEECESTGTHEPVMGFAAATPEDSTIKQSDAYREQFTAWINEQPAEGIAWRERMAAGRPDLNDVLSTITAPVAVICGDKDPSSPPSVMAPIADAMTATSTDMTVVFDCGHFSAYEHPQAVADALLALVCRVQ